MPQSSWRFLYLWKSQSSKHLLQGNQSSDKSYPQTSPRYQWSYHHSCTKSTRHQIPTWADKIAHLCHNRVCNSRICHWMCCCFASILLMAHSTCPACPQALYKWICTAALFQPGSVFIHAAVKECLSVEGYSRHPSSTCKVSSQSWEAYLIYPNLLYNGWGIFQFPPRSRRSY